MAQTRQLHKGFVSVVDGQYYPPRHIIPVSYEPERMGAGIGPETLVAVTINGRRRKRSIARQRVEYEL